MNIKPRPHQKAALRDIAKGFKKYDRGQCIMACGTGKSYVSAWAAQQSGARTILVLVPSLSLVRQLLRDFRVVAAWNSWAPIAVCCDETVNGQDVVTCDPSEVGCAVTTDVAAVHHHLQEPGVRVVFCTYHSAPLLKGLVFGLGIFDEAHRTAGLEGKLFGFALDDGNIPVAKRLFLTATPRVVRQREGRENVVSMGDERVYGPVFHALPFRAAVAQGIICGYRIIISEINEDVNTKHPVALQVAVQKTMDAEGVKHSFSYHKTVAAASGFAKDARGFSSDVLALHVNGTMNSRVREQLLRAFEHADKAILTNARCLTEGVDVPAVDMVIFAQAKRSTIDIVQAAGRAMRTSPGKTHGFIFVPLWRNRATGETFEEAMDREGFRPVLDILRALANQDEVLQTELEDLRNGKSVVGDGIIDLVTDDPVDLSKMRRAITHAVVDVRREAGYWTKERCHAAALKFTSRGAFMRGNYVPYNTARINGWLCEVCAHMGPSRRRPTNYSEAEIIQVAATFPTAGELLAGNSKVYSAAHKRGLLAKLYADFKKSQQKYSTAELVAVASKYSSVREFRRGDPQMFASARKTKRLVAITAHMLPDMKAWAYAEFEKVAAPYATKMALRDALGWGVYNKALRRGWISRKYGRAPNARVQRPPP